MRPPPIYPQLPLLHNHGLAILACITPFRNMKDDKDINTSTTIIPSIEILGPIT
jgi:hypothetical protein